MISSSCEIEMWKPDFVSYLNNNNLNLAFTFKMNPDHLAFLHFELIGDPIAYRVITSLFRKLTADNMILHASSCLPAHTIKSIPVGELPHTMRACSGPHWFVQQNQVIVRTFKGKGLSKMDIRGGKVTC